MITVNRSYLVHMKNEQNTHSLDLLQQCNCTLLSLALATGGKHDHDVTRHTMGKTHLSHKKIVA